jgi:[acyl-carrier-protein] S-malonyltransferase
MGRALRDAYPVAAAALADADAAFADAAVEGGGPSLSSLLFDGPDDELNLTEHTQPAIVAVSVAAAHVLGAHGVVPRFAAGHSLGEYSAHVVAGTLTLADAVATVRRRGRFMQEAVPVGTGTMAAILGATPELVAQACEEAADGEVVSPASMNGGGQVVIAGTAAAVRRASERAKALGAKRAIPLTVSAPFHCALMMPAQERLEPLLRALPVGLSRFAVVTNVDAVPVHVASGQDAPTVIDALIRQVSAPVQWEACVRRLALEGVTTYVEVGPGTVLSGLVKQILPDATVVNFGSPDDLAAVLDACSISPAR